MQYAVKYDVVSELANAIANLTFEQMARGDGNKAKFWYSTYISWNSKLWRSVSAASTPTFSLRSQPLNILQVKALGIESCALFHTVAVSNLTSEHLCERLFLQHKQREVELTVIYRQNTRSTETVADFPLYFDNLHVFVNFFVTKNLLFGIIIGGSTLEALRWCLDFELQQVTLNTIC